MDYSLIIINIEIANENSLAISFAQVLYYFLDFVIPNDISTN